MVHDDILDYLGSYIFFSQETPPPCQSIHFRTTFGLFFKASPGAHPLILNRLAPGLALKSGQRNLEMVNAVYFQVECI